MCLQRTHQAPGVQYSDQFQHAAELTAAALQGAVEVFGEVAASRAPQHPHLQLYSSPVLLEELTDVIARPIFSQRPNSIGRTVREILADYIETVELVEPIEMPRAVRDPDDNHVVACALVTKTEIVVSGDKDLLDLINYQDLILTAATALQRTEAIMP